VGDRSGPVYRLGLQQQVPGGEAFGEALSQHRLAGQLWWNLIESDRPPESLGQRVSELADRRGPGPGQRHLLSQKPVGEQRLNCDRGNITLVDRCMLRGAVGCADRVPGAELRRP
jgi:hypothetical protein